MCKREARTPPHSGAHGAEPRRREGEGRQIRPHAHLTPHQLQRQSEYDFAADAVSAGRRRPLRSKAKALDIFIVAEQFRFASKLATLVPHHPSLRIPALAFAHDQNLPTASMVCSAFSLELYFKCLIRLGRKSFGREHDLAKLFALIGYRNRTKIRKYWNDHSGTVRSYLDLAYGDDAPKVDFDFVLSASKDAFVTMRYIYESGIEPNKGWLSDTIVEGTRTTILDKYPELENARQTAPLPETSFPW